MNFEPIFWQSEYETGIEEIDLQHRFFLSLINRIAKELVATSDATYRERLIDELARYAAFHFISEENLMFKFGYPGLEQHRLHHYELKNHLSHYVANPCDEVLGFLVDWFVHHTVKEDKKIGEFVRQTKAAAA